MILEKYYQKVDNLLASNNLSSSYIIEGPSGLGKLELANYFLKKLIREENFLKNVYSLEPEIVEKNGVKRKKQIQLKEIKKLLNFMNLKPINSSYNACIIQDAQRMTDQAMNALLKNLEEPRSSNIYIFVTENSKKLLPTIISRSIVFKIGFSSRNFILEKIKDKTSTYNNLLDIIEKPIYEKLDILENKAKNSHRLLEDIDNWILLLTNNLENRFIGSKNQESNLKINLDFKSLINLLEKLLELRKRLKSSSVSAKITAQALLL
jgi:DNA polymerase III delta prime subunit